MSSTNNSFRLVLPDDWEDRSVYHFMGPDDSGVQHGLSLVIERGVTTELSEYAQERIDSVVDALPNMQILKEEQRNLASGVSVYEVIYKWVTPDGTVSFHKLTYMIRDRIAYSFSANFSKKTMKTIRHEVDRIIESFEPGPAE